MDFKPQHQVGLNIYFTGHIFALDSAVFRPHSNLDLENRGLLNNNRI